MITKINICKIEQQSNTRTFIFETVIISTETNYDDQFKINKMLKNKIERIKAKKLLMERKNAWKERKKYRIKINKEKKKGNNLFSVVVNYQKM
jgi:hypothetical protein